MNKEDWNIFQANRTIPEEQKDKRLNYRSRNVTGIQRLSEVSTKLIK